MESPKDILQRIQLRIIKGDISTAEIVWLVERIKQLEAVLKNLSGIYSPNYEFFLEKDYWRHNKTHTDCARQLAIYSILALGALLDPPQSEDLRDLLQ